MTWNTESESFFLLRDKWMLDTCPNCVQGNDRLARNLTLAANNQNKRKRRVGISFECGSHSKEIHLKTLHRRTGPEPPELSWAMLKLLCLVKRWNHCHLFAECRSWITRCRMSPQTLFVITPFVIYGSLGLRLWRGAVTPCCFFRIYLPKWDPSGSGDHILGVDAPSKGEARKNVW